VSFKSLTEGGLVARSMLRYT